MHTLSLALTVVALVAALVSWAMYVRSMEKVEVALRPVGHIALQGGAIVLAMVGIALAPGRVATLGVGVPALALGALFFTLYSQRRTPVGELRVSVGDRLPPFSLTASDGTAFHTDELAGKRVLLKFFRGHW